MEKTDENKKQTKSANNKINFIIVGILAVIIGGLVLSALNTVSSMSDDYKKSQANNPKRAFDKTPVSRKKTFESYNEKRTLNETSDGIVKLAINPIECFNGKTKKEIYDIRKEYVEKSLFNSPSYKPNEEIFGSIVDGKDWWGLEPLVCSRGNESTTTGDSAVSRFINNPDLLVQTYFPFNLQYTDMTKEFCDGRFARNIPISLTYEASTKTITAKYEMSPFVFKNTVNYYGLKNINYPLILSGLNARDFGYEYMFISDTYNIKMLNDNNASEEVHKFADYIHVGGSCRVPEGCNNMSPRQTELEFNIKSLPAEMTVKLWKNKPMFTNFGADFYFKIRFEEV